MNQHIFSFKANSHILSLLGDELIGSDNLAIFELVKNSYDADASHVKIIFCVVMFGLINVNILYYSFSTLYQMCNLRQSL